MAKANVVYTDYEGRVFYQARAVDEMSDREMLDTLLDIGLANELFWEMVALYEAQEPIGAH